MKMVNYAGSLISAKIHEMTGIGLLNCNAEKPSLYIDADELQNTVLNQLMQRPRTHLTEILEV